MIHSNYKISKYKSDPVKPLLKNLWQYSMVLENRGQNTKLSLRACPVWPCLASHSSTWLLCPFCTPASLGFSSAPCPPGYTAFVHAVPSLELPAQSSSATISSSMSSAKPLHSPHCCSSSSVRGVAQKHILLWRSLTIFWNDMLYEVSLCSLNYKVHSAVIPFLLLHYNLSAKHVMGTF